MMKQFPLLKQWNTAMKQWWKQRNNGQTQNNGNKETIETSEGTDPEQQQQQQQLNTHTKKQYAANK